MALSISQTPNTAQHLLECGTEDCGGNCQFYCNPCLRPICDQCRDKHLQNPETKNHEVVPYKQRRQQLPVEKCMVHSGEILDFHCKECDVPLCSKCLTKPSHQGHTFFDLSTLYADNCQTCLEKIDQIRQHLFPTSKHLQEETKTDATVIKKTMNSLRSELKAEATNFKSIVDMVTLEYIDQVNKLEESLTQDLRNQDKTYEDYILYLNKLIKYFFAYLSLTKLEDNPLISSSFQAVIKPIPETSNLIPPVIEAGQFSKENIEKLFSRIHVPDVTPQKRKIKSMDFASRRSYSTFVKPTLSLSSSVSKIREYTLSGIDNAWHISIGQSQKLWVSEINGNFVQTDAKGNHIQKTKTSGGFGYHTVTKNGDLIYADESNNVITKITPGYKIIEFIKTGNWRPFSIHSSIINEDILVGMKKDEEVKVTRYSNAGKEKQNIQRNNKGNKVFGFPYYITKNLNGDICTSDLDKHAVVVVTASGKQRFCYANPESEFVPRGLCTDVLGHILVCDYSSETIHMLDQDGLFLRLLLTKKQGVDHPCSVCVDAENNLYVGQLNKTVLVYKYLQ